MLRAGAVSFEPRNECSRCRRPAVVCYCAHLPTLETHNRVLVLQHPRERDKAVGTAHMASLCLPHSHVAVGVDFSRDSTVTRMLHDADAPPILLFPSDDAHDLDQAPPNERVTLVVIDGTWHQARALLRKNRDLLDMPRYGFRPTRPSEYRIRREPREDYVSTIEAMALALGALERDPTRFQSLLVPFRAMVDMQLGYAARSSGARRRVHRCQRADTPSRLPPLLREESLLCVSAESNAWPHDRVLGRPLYPHELIHWVAVRPHDGSRLEVVLAPRLPLSRSPVVHAKLDEAAVKDGQSLEQLRDAWQCFMRPDDVICHWGPYGVSLAEDAGLDLGERRIDVRKVVGDVQKKRPGSLEDVMRERELEHEAQGLGRAGARLGMLGAVTEWLAEMCTGGGVVGGG
ncbi:MAG: tRNA-uridine aminocarboxypropyltransferase [Myxococcales bacterium]